MRKLIFLLLVVMFIISYKIGAGIEYFLSKNSAMNCEAAHFYTDTGKTNLDVWNWQYSAGIKYYF